MLFRSMAYEYVIIDGKEVDVREIYKAGYDAASVGGNYDEKLNPYNKDGNEDELYAHDEWDNGWNDYSWAESNNADDYVKNVASTIFIKGSF